MIYLIFVFRRFTNGHSCIYFSEFRTESLRLQRRNNTDRSYWTREGLSVGLRSEMTLYYLSVSSLRSGRHGRFTVSDLYQVPSRKENRHYPHFVLRVSLSPQTSHSVVLLGRKKNRDEVGFSLNGVLRFYGPVEVVGERGVLLGGPRRMNGTGS